MRLEKAEQHDVNVEINGTRSCEEHVRPETGSSAYVARFYYFRPARYHLWDEINYPESQKILLVLPRNLHFVIAFFPYERLLTVSIVNGFIERK